MALQLTLALHLSSFISAVIVSLASTLTPTCGYCRSRWPPSWMRYVFLLPFASLFDLCICGLQCWCLLEWNVECLTRVIKSKHHFKNVFVWCSVNGTKLLDCCGWWCLWVQTFCFIFVALKLYDGMTGSLPSHFFYQLIYVSVLFCSYKCICVDLSFSCFTIWKIKMYILKLDFVSKGCCLHCLKSCCSEECIMYNLLQTHVNMANCAFLCCSQFLLV